MKYFYYAPEEQDFHSSCEARKFGSRLHPSSNLAAAKYSFAPFSTANKHDDVALYLQLIFWSINCSWQSEFVMLRVRGFNSSVQLQDSNTETQIPSSTLQAFFPSYLFPENEHCQFRS